MFLYVGSYTCSYTYISLSAVHVIVCVQINLFSLFNGYLTLCVRTVHCVVPDVKLTSICSVLYCGKEFLFNILFITTYHV